MKITLVDVTKRFGAFAALEDVNLEIHSGELIAILGPSGSGKTTLLRVVAGLEWPDEGEVQFDGQDALSHSVGERNVGLHAQGIWNHTGTSSPWTASSFASVTAGDRRNDLAPFASFRQPDCGWSDGNPP